MYGYTVSDWVTLERSPGDEVCIGREGLFGRTPGEVSGVHAPLCTVGMGRQLMVPDQFSDQTMCFGGVSCGVDRCFAQHYLLMKPEQTPIRTAW
ncbi:hypothetical protein AYO28_02940 [Pseudomonas putida]|uniref:Uncharacterized protein n=1 Tax=Pseudomonas putida TaxID=303 RepID=A0A177SAQ1_PSEPU|nr:hypothetical protein AYO28_02940 [Pseudomonas putida]